MQSISFSGVDGSGKSTQLTLLKNTLEQRGKKVYYFHAVEFSLANRINRLLKGEKNFVPGKEKAVTRATFLSLCLRLKFLFIDMVRYWFLHKKLQKERYDYVISDRFFFDSLINVEFLSQQTAFRSLILWGVNILARWMPKTDFRFYFSLTAEDILSRERVPEQGREYLEQKNALFQKRITQWRFHVIDASQSKESIFSHISSELSI